MVDRVFYSWQTDSPSNTNRNFILTALEESIKEINNSDSIEINAVIDRDTLGLSGSPDITQSIFTKIDDASVFICDVSLIDPSSKRNSPNPNVLIELGYAVKSLGWDRIIMVMNTEYGPPEALPFDLRSKRVLTYHVASDASEKSPIRHSLRKTFTAALNLIFEKHGPITNSRQEHQANSATKTREADIKLFENLKECLPSKGSISFIDEQNMAGFSWPRKSLEQLESFYYLWNDPEHEFIDNEMESLRSKLHSLVGVYLGEIAINTFPAANPERQTVPPEWEQNNPKKFLEVVNKLHETAAEVVNTHQELMRMGRTKFEP